MSTCARVIQILEPDSDILVGSGGSQDQALEESGSVQLAIGQLEVIVIFQTLKLSNDYEFTVNYIENLVDPNPASIEGVPVLRTQGAFKLELDAQPDTVNYTLYWRVRVRSGTTTTQPIPTPSPSSDLPDSGITPITQGASSQLISFHQARSNKTYGFSELRIENLIDGQGQQSEWIQVVDKQFAGFTIIINPPTDTGNYNLVWRTP
jgi:hypothetical protein